MEQETVKNYFGSQKKKASNLKWSITLGHHQALRNLYGIDRDGKDLKLYWEVYPFPTFSLQELLKSKSLRKSSISSIIRQILSFICHTRKLDILHGGLIPQNILCMELSSDYLVKIRSLESCSIFSQGQPQNENYYPSHYQRNSFLAPDLIALCLLTLELYTGLEPSLEDVLSKMEEK